MRKITCIEQGLLQAGGAVLAEGPLGKTAFPPQAESENRGEAVGMFEVSVESPVIVPIEGKALLRWQGTLKVPCRELPPRASRFLQPASRFLGPGTLARLLDPGLEVYLRQGRLGRLGGVMGVC